MFRDGSGRRLAYVIIGIVLAVVTGLAGAAHAAPEPTNVAITKTGPATANPDGTITYTIVVTNQGPNSAPSVVVHDQTNGNLTSITDRPDGCSGSGLTVTCPLDELDPGDSVTLTLTLTVNSDVPSGTLIPNCARLSTTGQDTDPSDNASCTTARVETVPPVPPTPPFTNLKVAKTGPATVNPDDTVTYTVVVTNDGDADVDAADVTVRDLQPDELEYTDIPPQCQMVNGEAQCSLGTIPANQSVTLTFTAHVRPDTLPGLTIANCATGITSTSETDYSDNVGCANSLVEEAEPTESPTPTPSETPTETPTESPTETESPEPSPTCTETAGPQPTGSPSPGSPSPGSPSPGSPSPGSPSPGSPSPGSPSPGSPSPGPQPTGSQPGGTRPGACPPVWPSGGHGPHRGLPSTGVPLATLGLGAAGLIGGGLAAGAIARRRRSRRA